MLAGGYKEASISPLDDPFPSDQQSSIDDYEYLSDSDLDDEELSLEDAGLADESKFVPSDGHDEV